MGDPFVPNDDLVKDGSGAVVSDEVKSGEGSGDGASVEGGLGEDLGDPAALLAQAARIAELEAEVAGLRDQALRSVAEAQNVQKRARMQMDQERKFATEGLLRDLIPILDNFDRSLAAVEKGASLESVVGGLRTVDKQLRSVLERAGLKRVGSVGMAFDPAHHEAIVTHETEDHPEDTVLDEIEAGYVLHERVLRPARVRVSKRPE